MQQKSETGDASSDQPGTRRQRLNSAGDFADRQTENNTQGENVNPTLDSSTTRNPKSEINGQSESSMLDSSGDASIQTTEDTNGANGEADEGDCDTVTDQYLRTSLQMEASRSGGHRAGFDAFMTGFVLACFLSKHTTLKDDHKTVLGAGIRLASLAGAEALTNKLYAMGKDQPMIIARSNFCTTSKNHRERIQKLKKV